MNVIVTGVTGFIGKHFTELLLKNGYDVYAVARNPEKLLDLALYVGMHIIAKSLEDFGEEDFPGLKYDCFFHFAWSGVNRIDIDNRQIHFNNYKNSVKCLEIASKLGCRCFIDSGSKAEYGYQSGTQHENLICNPYNAYGREKLNFYLFAKRYLQEHHMLYVHPRFFSVIGIEDHTWSLISMACAKMNINEEMSFGPCIQLWNFMAVEDATDALYRLYENIVKVDCEDNMVFNIASYDTRVLRSFIEEIYMITRSRSKLNFNENPKNVQIDYMNPSIDKLERLTKWKPQISFNQEIQKIVEYINTRDISKK